MGEKSAQNLLDGLVASKKRGLARLLAGLAIQHVGDSVADLLAQEFGNMDALKSASVERLAQINGIGPILAESIHAYFHSPAGAKTIEELRDLGLKLSEDVRRAPTARAGADLSGQTIVVTGTLKNYQREEIEQLIRKLGGKPTGSVSKNTTFVIAGDKAGSKLEKAQALGLKVVTEAEFDRLIGKK